MDKDELLLNWARWNYGMRCWLRKRPQESMAGEAADNWIAAVVAMSESQDMDCEKAQLKMTACYFVGYYVAITGSQEPPEIDDLDIIGEVKKVSRDCDCLCCQAKRELCKWKEWDVIEEDPVAKIGLIIAKLHNDPKLGFSPN